jgi:hypothetical protein
VLESASAVLAAKYLGLGMVKRDGGEDVSVVPG